MPLKLKDLHHNWLILERLAEGMLGVVYRAFDIRREEVIALKVVRRPSDPNLVVRLKREAKVAESFRHRNLVQSKGPVEEIEDRLYLPMEYVKGYSLRSVIDYMSKFHRGMKKGLAVSTIISIMIQVLHGLSHLHEHGLVHRDLHPGNIMLTDNRVVKITDYGSIKDLANITSGNAHTFRPIGGALISSYEQIRWPNRVSFRSDLYSVGVLLYHCITLKYPYYVSAGSIFDLAELIQKRIYKSISKLTYPPLTGKLVKLIDRLLSNEPEERGKSAEEVAMELKKILPAYKRAETKITRLHERYKNLEPTQFVEYAQECGRFIVYNQDEFEVDLEFLPTDNYSTKYAKKEAQDLVKLVKEMIRKGWRPSERFIDSVAPCPICYGDIILCDKGGYYELYCGGSHAAEDCYFTIKLFKPNLVHESRRQNWHSREKYKP